MIDKISAIVLLSILGLWIVLPFMLLGYVLKIFGFTKIGEAVHTIADYVILWVLIAIILIMAFAITTNIMFYTLQLDITSITQLEEFFKIKTI
jgi:hypothetical protein